MTDPASFRDTSTQAFEPVPPEPGAAPVAEPVVPAGVKPGSNRPRSSMLDNAGLALALAVAIGGVGFAAGRMTAPATINAGATGANGFRNGGNFPGGGQFGNGYFGGGGAGNGGFRGLFGGEDGGLSIQGTVESVSGDTLTLKLASGQTIQISLSGTTTYHAQSTASAGDVKTGGTVIVRVSVQRGQGATSPSATDVTIVP